MKTIAKRKVIAALVIGLGTLAFASSAQAEERHSYTNDDDGRASNSCSGVVTNACGISFIKTTCSGSAANAYTDDHDEGKKDSRGYDESDDYHVGKNRSDDVDRNGDGVIDDRDRASLDHSDKTGKKFSDGSDASKVYICHRMGGATVTLSVSNDGWLHGHSKHLMDTIGKCSDFDNRDRSHDDDDSRGFSASDAESSHLANPAKAPAITPAVLSCLSAPAGTQVTVNGVTYTAPGGNAPGVTISIPGGFSAGGLNSMPSRGGVRSLR